MDKPEKGLTPESIEGTLLPKPLLAVFKRMFVVSGLLLLLSLWFEGLPYGQTIQVAAEVGFGIGSVALGLDQMRGLQILLRDPRFSDRKRREESGLKPDRNGMWLDDALMYRLITTGIYVSFMGLFVYLALWKLLE